MQQAMFHPKSGAESDDMVARALSRTAHGLLIVIIGLLPVLFIPTTLVPLGFSKTLIVMTGLALAIIFYGLATLREGEMTLRLSPGLCAFWGVALVALVAALFSGDLLDAFFGTSYGIHTAAFTLLMALVASTITILGTSKRGVMQLYIMIAVSAILLLLFHLTRLLFGADMLSFGLFPSLVDSPIGSWNDVALFFGLFIILSLLALEQLPLTAGGRALLSVIVVLSLGMLTVVNFFAVWLVLGIISLIVLIYSLTNQRFSQNTVFAKPESTNLYPVALSILIFMVSVGFLVSGSSLGNIIADRVGISYIQVTPSFAATMDIAKSVSGDSAFFGIGPNKFVDAWRLYKDPSINQTIFWATPFESGNGFITTKLITTGIVGALAWLVFLGIFAYTGARLLFGTLSGDRFWYFVASSSFIAGLYLWGMAFIYVPTATMLILAAACTGLLFASAGVLTNSRRFSLSMNYDRRTGFAQVALVMIVIIGAVSVLYVTGRRYAAVYGFNQALASVTEGTSLESVEQKIAAAHALARNDIFARQIALYQLARLEALLAVPEPTEAQVEQFQNAIVNGVNAGQLAVSTDPTEPLNYQVLGQLYSLLVTADMAEAGTKAAEAYERARTYDPHNPAVPFLLAQLYLREGKIDEAQKQAEAAIAMKRDYTDALLLLADIDISQNRIGQAVARTQAVVALEPNNPARFYQLGVLESAAGHPAEAIAAFRQAVALDPNHANARYLLALQLVDQGEIDEALQHLNRIAEMNPDNQQLAGVIDSLETTGQLPSTPDNASQVDEPEVIENEEGQVTTTRRPDTPLITPVNTVPDDDATNQSEE